jgi:hypothetical protein
MPPAVRHLDDLAKSQLIQPGYFAWTHLPSL